MVPRSPPYDHSAAQSSGSAPKMGLLGNSRDMQSLAAWLSLASDAVANFVMRTRYGLPEFKAMSETEMSFWPPGRADGCVNKDITGRRPLMLACRSTDFRQVLGGTRSYAHRSSIR